MFSFEQRSLREDMTNVYEVVSGTDKGDVNKFFDLTCNGIRITRDHEKVWKLDLRKYFFLFLIEL